MFDSLLPVASGGGKIPSVDSPLRKMIEKTWGTIPNFVDAYGKFAVKVQGSGFAWLVYNTMTNGLELRKTGNYELLSEQDPNLKPIVVTDVWEHAYYFDHFNSRA